MNGYIGDFAAESTIYFQVSTNEAGGGRVAPSSAFEVADFRVYKNGSDAQRDNESGYSIASPFDSLVGIHWLTIDLSDDTDAGFYAAGNDYAVVLYPDETVDGESISTIVGTFSIQNRITAQTAPISHTSTGSTVNEGNVDAGTHADTHTLNDTYYTIGDTGAGIDLELQFNIGENRVPGDVACIGRFSDGGGDRVHFYAYNYQTAGWDQISSSDTAFKDSGGDKEHQNNLNSAHVDVAGTAGDVIIRFLSTETNNGDEFRIDLLTITSVTSAGITLGGIAEAVWAHDIASDSAEDTAGYALHHTRALITSVSAGDTATSFTLTDGVASDDAYAGMIIMVEDETDEHYEVRRIAEYTSGRVVTLDRALSFTPEAGDHVYVMATGYVTDPDVIADAVGDITIVSGGTLTHVSNDDQGDQAEDVWDDGTWIYLANSSGGIHVFSVSDLGVLTHVDSDDQGGAATGVFGDGTFIFLANGSRGLEVYSVDGAGTLTHVDNDDQGGTATGVWCDGSFIYLANGSRGLEVYSVDGGGILTHVDNDDQGGDATDVWGDGSFIYLANQSRGIESYSVDGAGTLTHIDNDSQGGGWGLGVFGDGTFIYLANFTNGIEVYSVDGGGNFTHIDNDDQGGRAMGVWADASFIYLANDSRGLDVYTVDGSGILTHVANDFQASTALDVWGDGTWVYLANSLNGVDVYATEDTGVDLAEAIEEIWDDRASGDGQPVAAAVWNALQTTYTAAGTFGQNVALHALTTELNARTLVAADYFDPATDTVAQVTLCDTITTYTGNTKQTGDNFAEIGVAGVGLTDLGGMSVGMKAEVQSEANDALVALTVDTGVTLVPALKTFLAILNGDATNVAGVFTYKDQDGGNESVQTVVAGGRTVT